MSKTIKTIKIIRLEKSYDGIDQFDFKNVPQGYIHICCSTVPRIPRVRKYKVIDGRLADPTDQQVIDHAKKLMVRPDIFNETSEKDPEDFIFEIVEEEK